MKTLPKIKKICEKYKVELKEKNYNLHSKLQIEVNSNYQNKRWINQLEQEYIWCEQEVQDLNKKIKCLKNALKEKILKLKSEIFILKS